MPFYSGGGFRTNIPFKELSLTREKFIDLFDLDCVEEVKDRFQFGRVRLQVRINSFSL